MDIIETSVVLFVVGHLCTAIWFASKLTTKVATVVDDVKDIKTGLHDDLENINKQMTTMNDKLNEYSRELSALKGWVKGLMGNTTSS